MQKLHSPEFGIAVLQCAENILKDKLGGIDGSFFQIYILGGVLAFNEMGQWREDMKAGRRCRGRHAANCLRAEL